MSHRFTYYSVTNDSNGRRSVALYIRSSKNSAGEVVPIFVTSLYLVATDNQLKDAWQVPIVIALNARALGESIDLNSNRRTPVNIVRLGVDYIDVQLIDPSMYTGIGPGFLAKQTMPM